VDYHRVTIAVILRNKWRPCAEDDYGWFVVELEEDAKELVEELLVGLLTAHTNISRVALGIGSAYAELTADRSRQSRE
jgi:hypothetical protein